jgi:hypothetical protein
MITKVEVVASLKSRAKLDGIFHVQLQTQLRDMHCIQIDRYLDFFAFVLLDVKSLLLFA